MQIQNNSISFKQTNKTVLKNGYQVLLDVNRNARNKISSIDCLVTDGKFIKGGIGESAYELSESSIQAIKVKLQNSLKEISGFFEKHIK